METLRALVDWERNLIETMTKQLEFFPVHERIWVVMAWVAHEALYDAYTVQGCLSNHF